LCIATVEVIAMAENLCLNLLLTTIKVAAKAGIPFPAISALAVP